MIKNRKQRKKYNMKLYNFITKVEIQCCKITCLSSAKGITLTLSMLQFLKNYFPSYCSVTRGEKTHTVTLCTHSVLKVNRCILDNFPPIFILVSLINSNLCLDHSYFNYNCYDDCSYFNYINSLLN